MATDCVIAGVGATQVGRFANATTDGLRLQAAATAIHDIGGAKTKIDGLVTEQPRDDPQQNYAASLAWQLGLKPNYIDDVALSGAAAVLMLCNAVGAIKSRLCTTVLCVGGGANWANRSRPKRGVLSEPANDIRRAYGAMGAPLAYALAARRQMFVTGVTSRQFGAVAVAMRKHASLNPDALMREPITIDDHQRSRWIVEPLRLLDCSVFADGAGAFVVTSVDRGDDYPARPINIEGLGSACQFGLVTQPRILDSAAAGIASRRAFEMAGLKPSDVDIAELYDCFTPVVIAALEEYGFCKRGEGGSFVECGSIELGGELPVNTHGGLLSNGHVSGILHIIEGVRQLRYETGARQVSDAQVAIVNGQCGETGIHATALLSRALRR